MGVMLQTHMARIATFTGEPLERLWETALRQDGIPWGPLGLVAGPTITDEK